MPAHPNAAFLRGMAEGRQVMTRYTPQDADFQPLQDAPTTAMWELMRPGLSNNPGRWEFAFADELETA